MKKVSKVFHNSSKPVSTERPNCYGFTCVPSYLRFWDRLLQASVSQVSTYVLTGKFHNYTPGIYKYEGGVWVAGKDITMFSNCVMSEPPDDKVCRIVAETVTQLVLDWEPEDPVASMLQSGLDSIEKYKTADIEELSSHVLKFAYNKSPFAPDALRSFFDGVPEISKEYARYCLTKFVPEPLSEEEADKFLSAHFRKEEQNV